MRIQLDTIKKTIKLDESIKFSTLIDTLKKLLPNNEWKQFTLEASSMINWTYHPFIIRGPYWEESWHKYKIDCNTVPAPIGRMKTDSLVKGVFDIQLGEISTGSLLE